MNRKITFITLLTVLLMVSSCKLPYRVTSVQRTRILVDSRYDAKPDAAAAEFLKPYKHVVDSIM
jgi:hypothetical protein